MRIKSIANQLMSNATMKKVGSKFIVVSEKGKNLMNLYKISNWIRIQRIGDQGINWIRF